MHGHLHRRGAVLLVAALLFAGALAAANPNVASADPAPYTPTGNDIQGFGPLSIFSECFQLSGGKNPGKVVVLETSNFGRDRVTVGKSNQMCEAANRFQTEEEAYPPFGPVQQCFKLDGGVDPNRPIVLHTATFGDLRVTVRQAVSMCENAIKFRPDRDPYGFGGNFAMECFSVADATPTSGTPAVLATNNFGVNKNEIRRLNRICESAVKFRQGFEPYGFMGPVWACFDWGSNQEYNQIAALQTRNFKSDLVTIVRSNMYCEPAAKSSLTETEMIIDADGFDSPFDGLPGAKDPGLLPGTPLKDFPTGDENAGLDWFDNDGNAMWTAGDDLHSESEEACPTAIGTKNGIHDLGEDCKILDIDNSLFDGQQVS
jgi:hypothetical protein